MTEDRKTQTAPAKSNGARRPWAKPTITAYGPIGKLTQGASGTMSDGSSGKKSCL